MPADEEIRITLRLPESLRDRLTEAADASSRSMNGEIVQRLSTSFSRQISMFPEFGDSLSDVRAPTRSHHAFMKEDELLAALDEYTENARECVEILKIRRKEAKAGK